MSEKKITKKSKWKLWLVKLLLILIILSFVAGGFLFIWISKLEIPDIHQLENLKMSQATKIYDRTGNIILYNIYEDEKRTIVPLDKISKYLQWASIAIEDEDFYQHNGAQPWRLLGSIYDKVVKGKKLRGASTITQQVIKQTVLTPKRDITRKIKEIILAYKLESLKKKQFGGDKKKAKDSILEMYLNENPYGGTLYGVEEASNFYFGKHASDLTLAESAYLASMPQAPTTYSPYGSHRKLLDARKNTVLRRMLEQGYISREEYKEAVNEKVNFVFRKKNYGIKAPHYVMKVKKELEKIFDEETLKSGGLKVYTSLDYDLQEKIQEIVKKNIQKIEEAKLGAHNGAVVVIDPKTGEVLTMVGSKDYWAEKDGDGNEFDGKFNVATAVRQPGSTFKPFAYMTAFQKGYTPKTVIWDVKTEFSDYCEPNYVDKNGSSKNCYHPNNFDHKFKGPILMEQALPESRNIPAIKTLYLAGLNDTFKNIKKMGIKSLNKPVSHYGLSLVLGAGEVQLLNLVSAYGVWANQGVRVPPKFILRVENSNGEVIYEPRPESERVVSKRISLILSRILSDNKLKYPTFGLHSPLYFTDREVASKTGTTNDNKDFWTVGFNPGDIALGVWVGNNDNKKAVGRAGLYTKRIWRESMEEALKDKPKSKFERVEENYSNLKPVLRGVWQGNKVVKIDTLTGNLATDETPEEFIKEIVYPNYHSILHWVYPKNPRAQIPTEGHRDKSYKRWEYGVQNWINNHFNWVSKDLQTNINELMLLWNKTGDTAIGLNNQKENQLRFEVLRPKQNETFSEDENMIVQIGQPENVEIKNISIFINGEDVISTDNNLINIDLSKINNLEEKNILKIIVTDINDKEAEKDIYFYIKN